MTVSSKKIYALLFLLCFSLQAIAQFYTQRSAYLKANSNWFFGQLGMDMKQEPPQLIPTQPFFLTFHCGGLIKPASNNGIKYNRIIPVSDPQTGALRFIATWNNLLDKNIISTPNGNLPADTVYGGFGKAVAVIPVIGNPDQYYLVRLTNDPLSTISYFLIDMQLNDGLGDIVTGSNTMLTQEMMYDDAIPEIIDVIPGNNCDLWLLIAETGFSAKKLNIRAYNITAAGIDPTPVISTFDRENEDDWSWEFQVSPGRNLISFITYKNFFDGQFTPDDQLDFLGFDPDNGTAYKKGMPPVRLGSSNLHAHGTFTPDNNYYLAYASKYTYGQATLYQYELGAYNDNYKRTEVPYNFVYSALPSRLWSPKTIPPLFFFKCYNNRIFFSIPQAWESPSEEPGFFNINAYLVMRLGQFSSTPGQNPGLLNAGPEIPLSQFSNFYTSNDVVYPYVPADTIANVYFDTVFCYDPGVSFTPVTLKAKPGFSNYLWNDGTTGNQQRINAPGKYWVSYKGSCSSRVDTFIYRYRVLKKLLPPDSIVCDQRFPVYLKARDGDQYLWEDNSIGAERNIYYPGTYWLQAGAEGCTAYDTITLTGKYCPCQVSVPNAFTPNGDGLNDNFKPVIAPGCVPSQYSLSIFNRWGQVVYSSFNEFDQGWDGTDKGKRADAGTYFYEIRFKSRFLDNDYLKKGELVLVR